MRIGIRRAHTKNSYGATGYLDEWVESRNLTPKVIDLLKDYHTIIDCTPDENQGYGEWNIGVNKANNSNLDLFFSLHFNSANGDPRGSEVCVYSLTGTASNYGKKICKNLNKLGFINRGVKQRTDLAETANIKCPSMVIEVCFVQESDGKLYKQLGVEKIARAIANAIESKVNLTPPANINQGNLTTDDIYRVRLNWEDSKSQKGAFKDLNNAIKECDKYSNYKVYNSKGVQVYPIININKTKLISSYLENGKATITGATTINIRNSYLLENNDIVSTYNRGEFFYYDKVFITEYNNKKYVWCSYISISGIRRYVCAKEDNLRYLTCV